MNKIYMHTVGAVHNVTAAEFMIVALSGKYESLAQCLTECLLRENTHAEWVIRYSVIPQYCAAWIAANWDWLIPLAKLCKSGDDIIVTVSGVWYLSHRWTCSSWIKLHEYYENNRNS